jgi:uncharacterized membrane protein YkgB
VNNTIWHNPERNKTFLKPPRREVASEDLGISAIVICVGVISGVNCQFRKKTSLENRCVSSTED